MCPGNHKSGDLLNVTGIIECPILFSSQPCSNTHIDFRSRLVEDTVNNYGSTTFSILLGILE